MATPSPGTIRQSMAALQSADAKGALEIRNLEFGEDPSALDPSRLRLLELILTRTPALFADYPAALLQPLRIAAAMMELWGTNEIPDYVKIDGGPEPRFSPQAIGHMIHAHACFMKKLEEFRAVGIKRVEFLGAKDPSECKACREADGQSFTTEDVPELPLATCQCKTAYGCRVKVIAYVK